MGRLWVEKEIAVRRANNEIANVASVNKSAMSASFHGGKAHSFFKSVVEKLTG